MFRSRTIGTKYGTFTVLDRDEIFKKVADEIIRISSATARRVTVGLTGGETPKAFYQWAVAQGVFTERILEQVIWMASDERYVPLESNESNFGNADRLMLSPLGVSNELKYPWKVNLSPEEAVEDYNNYFNLGYYGEVNQCFDLCLLGMGEDCHIASLFPGNPLLKETPEKNEFVVLDAPENFVVAEVPGKGTRLTITPSGLRRSRKIMIVVSGKAKHLALERVFKGECNLEQCPAQLSSELAYVDWLVDKDAAGDLEWTVSPVI